MEQFRFLGWKVYKDSQKLFSLILKLTEKLPNQYKFSLCSQILRASFSVVLNIAEGSGKDSDFELNRYLGISLGSLYELLASLDTLKKNQLITENQFIYFYRFIKEITDQIGGFKRKLPRKIKHFSK